LDEINPWHFRAPLTPLVAARRRGVNLRTVGAWVLAVPPLTIARSELRLLGRVLKESLDEVAAE
jgi:adenosylmethionine-8-amino-7-oxononanoate aminotransferase